MSWILSIVSNPGLLSIISGLFGGVILTVVEKIFSRKEKEMDIATAIRNELRGDIQNLRDEVKRLDKDLDDWRTRYFELLKEYNQLTAEYKGVKAELEEVKDTLRESHQWKDRYIQLLAEHDELKLTLKNATPDQA